MPAHSPARPPDHAPGPGMPYTIPAKRDPIRQAAASTQDRGRIGAGTPGERGIRVQEPECSARIPYDEGMPGRRVITRKTENMMCGMSPEAGTICDRTGVAARTGADMARRERSGQQGRHGHKVWRIGCVMTLVLSSPV